MAKIAMLRVNGKRQRVDADSERTLLSVLREELDLTGTKYGCGEGQCGACTVLLDGKPVRSCITTLGSVGDREITTIEGVAKGDQLHPLQQAFLDAQAMQCGYCTPGMIVAGVALLRDKPKPTQAEIIKAMNGHICRCGTYPRIVEAVRMASARGRG